MHFPARRGEFGGKRDGGLGGVAVRIGNDGDLTANGHDLKRPERHGREARQARSGPRGSFPFQRVDRALAALKATPGVEGMGVPFSLPGACRVEREPDPLRLREFG